MKLPKIYRSHQKIFRIGGSWAIVIPIEWLKSKQKEKVLPKNLSTVEFNLVAEEKIILELPVKSDINIEIEIGEETHGESNT